MLTRRAPVRAALLALAAGGFAIGTSEFLMLGLLPQVADDLSVSIPTAGQLISGYAVGVVVGAPLLTAASLRFGRKELLIALMSAYALGNLLTAVAPNYPLVLLARFATGLPHGAFFGAGAVVATRLAPPHRRTLAVSIMFAGLTIANVVGVPASTLLGQGTSWRLVYAAIGVLALGAVTLIALCVPHIPRDAVPSSLRAELRMFARPDLLLVLAVAIIGGAGLFATFSYIAPMLTDDAGFADSSLTWLLALFGIGMTLGNLVGARLAERFAGRTLLLGMTAQGLLSLVFAFSTHSRVAAALLVLLIPAAALMALPGLQGRIIRLAGGAPNIAAASMQAAFNIANSLGAYAGGLAIAAGYGLASPNVVAAVAVGAGLTLAIVVVLRERDSAVDRSAVSEDAALVPV